jgi:hypothetical protein
MATGIYTLDMAYTSGSVASISTNETILFEQYIHPDDLPGTSPMNVSVLVVHSSGANAATYRIRTGGTYVNILTNPNDESGTIVTTMAAPASAGPFKITGTCVRPTELMLFMLTGQTGAGSNVISTCTLTFS